MTCDLPTRTELTQRGRELRERLGLSDSVHASPTPGYDGLSDELVFGAIWSRPGLALDERMMSVLCVLAGLERHALIKDYVEAALRLDIKPRAIQELFLQASLYSGFASSESACRLAQEVFDAQGVTADDDTGPDMSAQELAELGAAKLVELHGERGTLGYAAPDNPTTGPLYTLASAYGYGALWHRAGLTRRQRFICSVATFTALGLEMQVAKFAQSAERNDLTRSETVEVIMQVAPYCGFPRSLNALALVDQNQPEYCTRPAPHGRLI
ncbi:MAG: 4-carboxymuconolactone decarboxylase [Gammaproteobacteria bacterium]|jgi:4-carboxymuconolactone decarboxylase